MKSIRNSRLAHILGMLLAMFVWLANLSNPPTGRTGAPFDSGSCSDCHNGGSYAGTIEVSGMPGTISPNTVYPLTITMTPTAGTPIRGGFQLVAVDGSNANSGNLTNSNGQSGTEFFSTREYLEHRGGKTFGGNPIAWDFTWTSPSGASGNTVKFYMIGNFTNGNGGQGGDNAVPALETYTFAGAPAVTATITSSTNVLCNGGNTGSATAEGDGGVPPYTYLWSNNQNQATAINLIAGTYTVTVTASGGSGSATATVVITQPTVILASASVSGSLNCINTQVTVTANASGGTGPYSFSWSNGEMGNPATYTNAGTGSVTVTDANNCTKVASFNVMANTTAPIAAASSTSSFTCVTPSIQLSGSGSSVGAGFTYFWSASSGGNIVSGGTTLTPTVNGCATYTIQVSNATNGCTSTASVAPACNIVAPNASATGAVLTCSAPSAQIFANSTTPGVIYTWAGPGGFTSTQQNPTASATGVYTVTVLNPTNSCTATATATVTQNTTQPPNTSATGGVLTCTAPTLQILGSSTTPGATYAWSGACFSNSQNQQSPVVCAAGTYTLTVTNPANGCTITATAAVTSDQAPPNISATGATLTCAVTTVQVCATSTTPNAAFSWAGPGGFTSATPCPNVSVAGTYTATATNPANGCTASATVTVVQDAAQPANLAAVGGQITCAVATTTVCATSTTPNVTFAWTGPNNFTSTQACANTSVPGSYTVTALNPANGCTASATATVTLNTTAPVASIATPPQLNCNTTTIALNATGSSQGANFAYTWTATNGGHIVSGSTSLTPLVDSVGTYTLLVTNTENGCTTTVSTTVSQTPAVTGAATATNIGCFGGSNGTVTATGGGGNGAFDYAWNTSDTTPTVNNLGIGTYTATVTDADGCTATASATVTQPTLLAANATATGQTAVGENDGTASAAPSGGTSPYTYLWSNNATTATITGLAPGNFTVITTDANGCSAVQTVTVNTFGCNLQATIAAQNVTCQGASNGTATVTATGANTPFTYLWSNDSTTASVSGLAPGTYTATVTDAANCETALSVSILEPAALVPNATSTGVTGVGISDGTATASPTGGTSPYTFAWSNDSITLTITGLTPGSYTVTVTDARACTSVQTVLVNAFNCNLVASVLVVHPTCFGAADGSATATVSGATGAVTYKWSNGSTTATATGLKAGVYTVTATDAAGCIAISTTTATQPAQLIATASTTDVPCPLSPVGTATITVIGGMAPYTYQWSGSGSGNALTAGTYTVSITDANGCSTTVSFTILSLDNQAPVLNCPGSIIVCGADIITFPLPTVSDNCSPMNPQPVLVSGQASGTAFLDGITTQVFRATDLSGNSGTCSFTVTVNPIPDILLGDYNGDTNSLGLGYINITPVGGTAPYVLIWTKDNEFFSNEEDLDSLFTGSYRLQLTDANGCQVLLSPVVLQNTVGTSEPWQLNALRLWPNPTNTAFRLEMNGLEPVAAQIVTPQGRLVQVINPADLSGEIQVEQLPAGFYYLRLVTKEGWQGVVKWVKGE